MIIAVTLYLLPYANVITPLLVAFAEILFLLLFILELPILKIPDTTLYILLYVTGVPTAFAYTPLYVKTTLCRAVAAEINDSI